MKFYFWGKLLNLENRSQIYQYFFGEVGNKIYYIQKEGLAIDGTIYNVHFLFVADMKAL